jgi:hypothetical protein
MSSIVIAVFAGAVFGLLLLSIGLVAGFKIGRLATPRIYVAGLGQDAKLDRSDLQGLVAAWVETRIRLMELALAAREMPDLPSEFAHQWRREVVRLTEDICHTIDHKPHSHDMQSQYEATTSALPASATEPARDSMEQDVGEDAGPVISNEQILELLDGLGRVPRDDSLPMIRYKFNVKQPLARAVDQGPLEPEAFRIVQCHDLSGRDIRYFVEDPAIEGMIIMGLGVPRPVKWVAARVEDSRSTYRYGRVGYLVTAKLLASIDRRDHELSDNDR